MLNDKNKNKIQYPYFDVIGDNNNHDFQLGIFFANAEKFHAMIKQHTIYMGK